MNVSAIDIAILVLYGVKTRLLFARLHARKVSGAGRDGTGDRVRSSRFSPAAS